MLSEAKHLWSNVRNRMGTDVAIRTTVALIALSLVLVGCHKHVAVAQVDPNGPVEVVVPEHGAYTGAFMDFGDEEDDVTLEGIEDFEQMVGKHQAIIASSSYWGEQDFPVDNLNVIWLVSNGGEPQDMTHILVSFVYKKAFNLYRYGYGAALSMLIFAALLAFSMFFLRRTRATESVYA